VVRFREVDRALSSKGFDRQERKRHVAWYLVVDGVTTRRNTFASRSDDEFHNGRLSQMAREIGITRDEFMALVSCELSGPDLVDLLRKKGVPL
jgi:hypothetical protein